MAGGNVKRSTSPTRHRAHGQLPPAHVDHLSEAVLAMSSLVLISAGSNAHGQLATGHIDDVHHFVNCNFLGAPPGCLPSDIVALEDIACGANHTLALLRRRNGSTELWGCGDGRRQQLGPSYVAVVEKDEGQAVGGTAIFRPLDLKLYTLESQCKTPLDGYTVRLIAAGWETSYAVLSCSGRDDILLSMGADDFGNLGVGPARTPDTKGKGRSAVNIVPLRAGLPSQKANNTLTVLTLSAGPHHTVAHIVVSSPDASAEAHVVGWGTARHGQLGSMYNAAGRPLPYTSSPNLIPIPFPEQVVQFALGNQHTVCLRCSGSLDALGSNRKEQLSGLADLHDIERIASTWNGTYALLRSGMVVAAGSNTHSQLGRGTSQNQRQSSLGPVCFPFDPHSGRIVDIACGSEHALCIVEQANPPGEASREVWGWGWNEHGNLGIDGTEDIGIPVQLWPRRELDVGRVKNIWAGCGTSWILLER
ncbi:regulator of chromosome condensation 1/beta-lactamase-inhibitor protein II [Trametes gibbosa]|nr:regulator of chromosome condensation 1/beta-lactamase-inhibitor protein II [Trametes gibbosa]